VRESTTAEGKVVELLPSALVRVALDDGRDVVAHIGGRFKMAVVRLLPGDRVRVEVTPYDAGRGRIVAKLGQ
jgi:translation initiation factor IF-1